MGIVSGSTINLNFTGSPDAVVALLVDNVAQVPGLYGSAASGATHPLPQFAGTGKILVTGPLAVSRKIHGAGTFDVYLPIGADESVGGAPRGIECRSGGASNNYQLVITFLNTVTFTSASVTSGTGSVSSTAGNGTTVVTVNLTGVTNAQKITITLFGVNDGTTVKDIPFRMGVLLGDTNADRFVNSGDALQTRSGAGQATSVINFRSDVNIDGVINSGDTTIVRARAGTTLP